MKSAPELQLAHMGLVKRKDTATSPRTQIIKQTTHPLHCYTAQAQGAYTYLKRPAGPFTTPTKHRTSCTALHTSMPVVQRQTGWRSLASNTLIHHAESGCVHMRMHLWSTPLVEPLNPTIHVLSYNLQAPAAQAANPASTTLRGKAHACSCRHQQLLCCCYATSLSGARTAAAC